MSLFLGTCSITFEEPDLTARFPVCLSLVAAALSVGWKLGSGGQVNHDDVLLGPLHIQDFKAAAKSKVSRQITWRFQSAKLVVLGREIGVDEFMQWLAEDVALRRWVEARANFQHYLDQLELHYVGVWPSLKAVDTAAHDRAVIVPVYGDALMKARQSESLSYLASLCLQRRSLKTCGR